MTGLSACGHSRPVEAVSPVGQGRPPHRENARVRGRSPYRIPEALTCEVPTVAPPVGRVTNLGNSTWPKKA